MTVRERIGSLAQRLRERVGRSLKQCGSCGKPTRSHVVSGTTQCHECHVDGRPLPLTDGGRVDDEHDDGDRVETVRPAWHESEGYLWYTANGDAPYWFLRTLLVDHADGHHEIDLELPHGPLSDANGERDLSLTRAHEFTMEFDGVPWHVDLGYSDSGMAPRLSDGIERDVVRDWEIHLEGPGQSKCHFQVKLRHDDMRGPDGRSLSIPWCGGEEGYAVHFESVTIPLDDVPRLLDVTIRALGRDLGVGVNLDYFQPENVRPDSTITTAERYLRVTRDMSRKLIDNDGVFDKTARLLSNVDGSAGAYKWNNEQIVGQYHAVELDGVGANELIAGHSAAKRIKHYHPKHVRSSEIDDDPMSSPAVRVAFSKSLHDESWRWGDRDRLVEELVETVVNLFDWAGIPTEPNRTTFAEDDHFDPTRTARVDVDRRANPLPEIEAQQEHQLVSVLDELAPATRESVQVIADGGPEGVHYETISEKTGYSISSVYRALEDLGEVVESDVGRFKFASAKLRQEVTRLVDSLDDMIESTADRVAEIAGVELRSRASSALDKWLAEYGAEIDGLAETDEQTTIRFDTLFSSTGIGAPPLDQVLAEGLEAWRRTGRESETFDEFLVRAEEQRGLSRESVSGRVRHLR